jgi:hypothetical protein
VTDNLLDEMSTWLDRHGLAHAEVTTQAAASQISEGMELTRRALGLDDPSPVCRSATLPAFAFCNAAHGSGAYKGQRLGRELKEGLRSCRCGIVLHESETSGGTKLSRAYTRRTKACNKRHAEPDASASPASGSGMPAVPAHAVAQAKRQCARPPETKGPQRDPMQNPRIKCLLKPGIGPEVSPRTKTLKRGGTACSPQYVPRPLATATRPTRKRRVPTATAVAARPK